MSKVFQFGERLPEYAVPVLNEREARAGAGILFFMATIAFMNAWLTGDFFPIKIVVIGFFIDFFIRVLVNPKFAPSLVLGRIAVRNQKPEYVGAPQKRFAWAIGLVLATAMLYLVVFQDVRGPVNLLVCSVCLLLLFFETAFGICIGCAIYNLFNRERAQLCPGEVCEVHAVQEIQRVGLAQVVVVLGFLGAMTAAANVVGGKSDLTQRQDVQRQDVMTAATGLSVGSEEAERCKVPAFAIAIGHVEKWKLHNNCR
ncbi:DUF4395 domain-containing protein [Bradyrhizobium sp.]|uniref:DUF4395 domain-containing protein n=1 Tax=Bradyrhizobium sp. TaxID=376 RepID=UPI002734BBC9|nr:DUF4395 domain-containing protein [Bradyrhizobium sp.]MDP3694311.1 DUF4395 domain-containing protein [Bradyrhizobium sp.]